jgi:hypothetical protein
VRSIEYLDYVEEEIGEGSWTRDLSEGPPWVIDPALMGMGNGPLPFPLGTARVVREGYLTGIPSRSNDWHLFPSSIRALPNGYKPCWMTRFLGSSPGF